MKTKYECIKNKAILNDKFLGYVYKLQTKNHT